MGRGDYSYLLGPLGFSVNPSPNWTFGLGLGLGGLDLGLGLDNSYIFGSVIMFFYYFVKSY